MTNGDKIRKSIECDYALAGLIAEFYKDNPDLCPAGDICDRRISGTPMSGIDCGGCTDILCRLTICKFLSRDDDPELVLRINGG